MKREVVHIDQRYHPFLMHDAQVKAKQEATGVKVRPPGQRHARMCGSLSTPMGLYRARTQISYNDSDEVAVQGNRADVDALLSLLEEVYAAKVRGDRKKERRGTRLTDVGGDGVETGLEHHFDQHQQEAAPRCHWQQGRTYPGDCQDDRYASHQLEQLAVCRC
jgi:hypothetical protein